MGEFDDLVPAKKPRNPGTRERSTDFDDLIPVAGAPKDNLAALGDYQPLPDLMPEYDADGNVLRATPFAPLEPTTSNPFEGARARVYGVLGSGIRGLATIGERVGDKLETALPLSGLSPEQIANERQLSSLFGAADFLDRKAKEVGYVPRVGGDRAFEAITTMPGSLGELGAQARDAGTFAIDSAVSSLPDMAGALMAPVPYMLGRTSEIGEQRAVNDNRTDGATLGDLLAASPAAVIEVLGERLAAKYIPGLGGKPLAGGTASRIGKQVGIQAGTEGVQGGASYLGETVGTETGMTGEGLAQATALEALGGLGMAAPVAGAEVVANYIPKATQAPNAAPRETPAEVEITGGVPATLGDLANDQAVVDAFRDKQALGVPAEPTADLDAQIDAELLRNLPQDDAPSDALDPDMLAALNAALDPESAASLPTALPPPVEVAAPQTLVPLGEADGPLQERPELATLGGLGNPAGLPGVRPDPAAGRASEALGQPGEAAAGQATGADAALGAQARALSPMRAPLNVRMNGQEIPVESFEDASRKFLQLKDQADIGGMPVVELIDQSGNVVGNLGQSGEVFAGDYRNRNPREAAIYTPPGKDSAKQPVIEGEAERVGTTALAAPVQESVQPAGKLYQRGNGKNNSSAQALQLPDGTWRIRNRKAGTWQPWRQPTDKDGNPIDKFDPSPVFGYRETGMAGGAMNVPGVGKVPVQRSEKAEKADNYNPLLDLIAGSGGISKADAVRFGVDPAAMKARRGIRPLFSDKGVELDVLRERLIEDGYLPPEPQDAPPIYDHNDIWAVIEPALNGKPVGPMGDARIQAMAEQRNAAAYGEDTDADSDPDDDLARWFDEASPDEDIQPGDEAEAASIAELAYRATQAGADEFDISPFSGEPEAAYAARLWRLIQQQEAARGTDREAERSGVREGVPGREGGQAEPVQEFTLGQAAAPAPAQEVTSPSAGLFGAPSTRDFVDNAQRNKDAARDGKTGTGRTDMLAGDGNLFAGPAPEQAEIAAPTLPRETFKTRDGSDATVAIAAGKTTNSTGDGSGYRVVSSLKSGSVATPLRTIGTFDTLEDAQTAFDGEKARLTGQDVLESAETEVLAMFVGAESETADQFTLANAKELIAKGRSAETVRQETGWFTGHDGMWRYEISDDQAAWMGEEQSADLSALAREIAPMIQEEGADDRGIHGAKWVSGEGDGDWLRAFGRTKSEAFFNVVRAVARKRGQIGGFDFDKVKPGTYKRLDEVLHHPKLFAAYPQLRGYGVLFESMGDANGSFNPETKLIRLDSDRTSRGALSTLLHEIQHAVQYIEGFANGGNTDSNFVRAVRNRIELMSLKVQADLSVWLRLNEQAVIDAELAAQKYRRALMWDSAQRLLSYSEREAPSGVFRLIRNELQWIYDKDFSGNDAARDLQYKFYDIPKRGAKRNAAIRDLAHEGARVLMAAIPPDVRAEFKADPRKTRSMIEALARQRRKADAALDPKRALEREAQGVDALGNAHNFSGPYDIYRHLAGEVEARNTQARQHMPDEGRRRTRPSETQDVDSDKVIVMFGGVDIRAPKHMASLDTEELSDADLTPAEKASRDRQSIDRQAMREQLSREHGDADADANGLRDAVQKALGETGNKVIFLRNVNGLPEGVRGPQQNAAAQRGARMRTAGLFDSRTGEVYLFTDVVTTPQMAAFTASHEIAGHQGLRALLGDKLNKVLDLAEQNPTVKAVAASMTKQRNLRPDQRYLAIEEALADLAAANRTQNWQRITDKHGVPVPATMQSKLRAMLQNIVARIKALFGKQGVAFSDAQVLNLLENAWQAAQGDARATMGDMAESMEEVPALQKKLANVEGGFERLRKERKFGGPEWEAVEKAAAAIRRQLFALTGDYYGRPKVKMVRPTSEELEADYDSPSDVPKNVRDWVRKNASLLTSDATDAVRWGRIADTLQDDRYPSGDMEIFRAVQDGYYIREGDWVTTDRAYAEDHLRRYFNGRGQILSETVDGRDVLVSPTGNAEEAIYAPRSMSGPIGTPSSALESIEDQTQSEAFKKWFGDSKVVDADGKPLRVFHGTDAEFDTFKTDDLAYFAESEGVASAYGKRVIPAFLSIRNPLDLTDSSIADKVVREVVPDADPDAGVNAMLAAEWERAGFRDYAERNGFDGLILPTTASRDTMADGGRAFVVFRPHQIKSATANAGTFDPASDSILESVEYTPEQEAALTKAGMPVDRRSTLERVKAKLSEEWSKVREAARDSDALKLAVFDRFHGLRMAEAQMGLSDPALSPYMAARMSVAQAQHVEATMLYGAPKWDNGMVSIDDSTVGLLDALKPVEGKIDAWLGWMVGRRAKLLKAQGRENNLSDADIAALLSLADGNEAAFKQAAASYLKTKNAILDFAQEAGVIDPVGRAAWDHAEYIPFYRAENEGTIGPGTRKGLAGQNAGIRTLKGGENALADPLANIVRNFAKLIDAGTKNRAVLLAVDQLGARFFEPAKREMTPASIPLDQVKKHLRDQGVPDATLQGMPPGALRGVQRMLSIVPPTGENVVRVMRDGKAEYYEVLDPLVLRSLTAFKMPNRSLAVKPLIWFKRLLTTGVTTTAEFVGANFIRDSGSAWVMSDDRFMPGWDSLKGVANTLRNDQTAKDMMMAGGTFLGGNFYDGNADAAAAALRRALRQKGMANKDIEGFMGTVARSPLVLWDKWMQLSGAVENSNRRAVFDAAIKAGRSRAEAAFMARDLMDFNMQGDAAFIQFFSDVLPFFNARLQGMYKLGRRAGTKQGRKAIVLRGGVITLASLALYAWNVMAHGEAWDELEEWDKDAYWHIAPGTEFHTRIPKPFEIGLVFGTAPERGLEAIRNAMTGKGDEPSATWDSLVRALTGTLAINPIPQAFLPLAEQWANKRFFTGRAIEGMGDDKLLPEDRSTWFTSDTAKAVGRMSGLSPKRIEHLWNGYTAGLGGYVLDSADAFTRWVQDAPERAEMAPKDFPVVGRFYRGATPANSKYVELFYRRFEKAEQVEQSIKEAILKGEDERAAKLEAENADLLGERKDSKQAKAGFMFTKVKELRKVRDAMGKLRENAETVAMSESMSPAKKREALDEMTRQRNKLAREAVKQ